MLYRPSSRYDSSLFTTLSVGNMEKNAVTHPKQVYAFFPVIFTLIDPFNTQEIVKRFDTLFE
jgi:hypothetical protein